MGARVVDQKLDDVLKALSDSTRRLILDELHARDRQSLFELCGRLIESHQLSLTRQAVSKHLAVLESAELIRTSWSGRTKLHSLNPAPIRQLGRGWLNRYLNPKRTGK